MLSHCDIMFTVSITYAEKPLIAEKHRGRKTWDLKKLRISEQQEVEGPMANSKCNLVRISLSWSLFFIVDMYAIRTIHYFSTENNNQTLIYKMLFDFHVEMILKYLILMCGLYKILKSLNCLENKCPNLSRKLLIVHTFIADFSLH